MCCAVVAMPSPDRVTPDSPLRLSVAAALAFPDGSMSPSGLRREGARGRLVIERIAGKDYTTLANIERMRELCRVQAKGPRLYLRRARPSMSRRPEHREIPAASCPPLAQGTASYRLK